MISLKHLWKFVSEYSPILGYWIVAIGCTLAGYVLSSDLTKFIGLCDLSNNIFANDRLKLFIFFFLILPNYIIYYALFRGKDRELTILPRDTHYNWQNQQSFCIVSYIITLFTFFGIIYLWVTGSINFLRLLTVIGCSFPFYLWTGWLISKVKKSQNRRLFYRYRTFFPSLLTVNIPFVYGYSVTDTNNFVNSIVTLSMVAIILFLWLLAKRNYNNCRLLRNSSICLVLVLLFISLISDPFQNELSPSYIKIFFSIIQILFFTAVLSLMLGVLETSCITSRVLHDILLIDPTEEIIKDNLTIYRNTIETKSQYKSGTNVAFAFALPFFIMTSLHPEVNSLYWIEIMLILPFYLIIWVGGTNCKIYKDRNCRLGRFIGFGMVLSIILSGVGEGASKFFIDLLQTENIVIQIAAPITAVLISLRFLSKSEKYINLIGRLLCWNLATHEFGKVENALNLTMIISGILSLSSIIVWYLGKLYMFNMNPVLPLLPFLFLIYQVFVWIALQYCTAIQESNMISPKP